MRSITTATAALSSLSELDVQFQLYDYFSLICRELQKEFYLDWNPVHHLFSSNSTKNEISLKINPRFIPSVAQRSTEYYRWFITATKSLQTIFAVQIHFPECAATEYTRSLLIITRYVVGFGVRLLAVVDFLSIPFCFFTSLPQTLKIGPPTCVLMHTSRSMKRRYWIWSQQSKFVWTANK